MTENEIRERIETARQHWRLTEPEGQELRRMVSGLGLKESAGLAGLSPETVRARRKVIFRKSAAHGLGEVVALILEIPAPPAVQEARE